MNNKSPLVSIIVPAYNIGEYLPRCLDSLLNQTYKNIEIIVISDGSTDNTDTIIRKYGNEHNNITYIIKKNTGVSDTRNVGMDIATGDYIGFVDGDDYVEPEMFETLLKNAVENDADISHCGYRMVFPSHVDYYYNTKKKIIQDNKKGILDIIVGDYVEPSPCIKLYKKSIVENLRMPTEIKFNEDILFNFYAFVGSKKSVYEDLPLYHYILRSNSASTVRISKYKLYDPIKVWKEILDYSKKHLTDDISSIAYSRYLGAIINLNRYINNYKLISEKKNLRKFMSEIKNVEVDFPLDKRTKIERFLFIHFTGFHMMVYRLYDKFISKNTDKYEVK